MHEFSRTEALSWVEHQRAVLDAPGNPCNPFATSAWIELFLHEVASDDWKIVVPHDASDGTSMMLLYSTPQEPTCLRALNNYYASLYSPLQSTTTDRRWALSSLTRQVARRRPKFSTVILSPLDAESRDTATLAEVLSQEGWFVRRYFCFGNWTLPCAGMKFDDYFASRDSKLRNTWARKARKFSDKGSLEIAMGPAEVDAAMDAYEAVYARSWKEPEPYPSFIRGWAHRCAERGWLRLGIARIGDIPIAAQFWFTIGATAYIFKLAYDDKFSQWSAGTLLSALLFRHALDVDRVSVIDYLTGDDAYKQSWMTHRRERVGLVACNLRSPAGIARAMREMAGQATASFRTALRTSA